MGIRGSKTVGDSPIDGVKKKENFTVAERKRQPWACKGEY